MQDVFSRIHTLKRPRLLVRAAKFGIDDYDRVRHLPRALGTTPPTNLTAAVMRLLEIEHDLNLQRTSGSGDYSVARHVEVLVAIMAEAHLLRQTRPAAAT